MIDNAKPFLRWAGSKKKVLPELIKFWSPSFDQYIEPFVGSGQLFFSVDANNSIIGDINEELVITYQKIKENPGEIFYLISQFKTNDKGQYYLLRKLEANQLSTFEVAARFIYLNRYCFNGLYRTNNQGKFNVPFSNGATGNLPDLKALELISKKLSKSTIVLGDFEIVINKFCSSNSFVYLDPPFAIKNKRIFNQYNPASFGYNDLERLSKLLSELDKQGTKFLLSYVYAKETVEHFSIWNRKRIITQRNISGFANNRRRAAELLVTNID